jgi:D-alanyl-D-alanine carboxypeptidase
MLLLGFLALHMGCRPDPIGPSAACTPGYPFPLNPDHPKRAAIDRVLNRYVARGIPGATVLISDDDGFWVASAGYASLEDRVPMQPCHLNKLGSITKLMMGTLAWQLIQAGQLELNAPISRYIPETAEGIEYGEQITLGMLLNHTAGVYDIAGDLGYNLAVINDFTKSWRAEEILSYIEDKPARHAPGDSLLYSNSHTLLLTMCIEAATGRQHGELLRERIFEPLGMDHTVYYQFEQDFPFDNVAQGYLDFHNDGGSIQNLSTLNPGNEGFTGVYSTVTDLYRLMNALLREKTLTTPDNLDFIFSTKRSAAGQEWLSSFGAIHDEYRDVISDPDIRAYGHAGGDIGYSAALNYFPHHNTIFAATFNYGTLFPSDLGDILGAMRADLVRIMAE